MFWLNNRQDVIKNWQSLILLILHWSWNIGRSRLVRLNYAITRRKFSAYYEIFGQTNLMYISICTCSRSVEKFTIALWRATFGSSGGCQKRSVGKKEPWSQRSPRYSALSRKDWIRREIKPTRATSFLSSTRENGKKGEPGEKEAERGTRGRRRDRYRQRRRLHFSEHWVPPW